MLKLKMLNDFLIITNLILILTFLINYFLYWITFLKKKHRDKGWNVYKKIYLILWAIPVISIPIINSGFFAPFFGTVSYFKEYWMWFLILGIIFMIIGIRLGTMYLRSSNYIIDGKQQLKTKGVYEIMRHPKYADWAVIFLGLTLIFDSFFALLIAPFFILLLGLQGFLEEKFILIPKFGKKYEAYKKKTSSRLFPTPYNILLIIITIFIVYIGVLNFIL